jgi:hypothetical protein
MSNRFHLLLEVPDRETLAPLDEEGLLAVLPLLYEGHVVEGVKQELERARAAGGRNNGTAKFSRDTNAVAGISGCS